MRRTHALLRQFINAVLQHFETDQNTLDLGDARVQPMTVLPSLCLSSEKVVRQPDPGTWATTERCHNVTTQRS